MKQEKQTDLCLIKNMAQELGLSPWDVFMHWVEQGEIQKATVNITYKNGDAIEADLVELRRMTDTGQRGKISTKRQNQLSKTDVLEREMPKEENESQGIPVSPTAATQQPTADSAKVEPSPTPAAEPEQEIPPTTEEKPDDVPELNDLETSNPKKYGPNYITSGQAPNIKIGAYVYSTGAISMKYKALGPVQIRGIILSRSETSITIVKYIGNDLTAVDAIAQNKDGWRFLTYPECQKMVRFKDILNSRLAEMRNKQIKDALILLYRDRCNELYGFNVDTQAVHRTLNDSTVGVPRTFAVYLAKDLKIV